MCDRLHAWSTLREARAGCWRYRLAGQFRRQHGDVDSVSAVLVWRSCHQVINRRLQADSGGGSILYRAAFYLCGSSKRRRLRSDAPPGSESIFVAFITSFLFGEPVGVKWWVAAAICTCGIFLVTGAQPRTEAWRRHSATTALYSLIAALAFALTDTLIQHWAAGVGVVTFVAVMFSFVGILTCCLYVPAVGFRQLVDSPQIARKVLACGAFCSAPKTWSWR